MASQIPPQDVERRLNLGDIHYAPLVLGSQVVRRSKRILKCLYDFSVQGGAIGAIKLIDPVLVSGSKPVLLGVQAQQLAILPPSAIVVRALIDVITAPLSGGSATVSVGTGVGAADLLAATAKASFTGLLDGIPVNTAATSIKVSAATVAGVSPSMTIAVAALTAGKFNVHIEYYLSD